MTIAKSYSRRIKMTIRKRIFYFAKSKIAKCPEGAIMPKWLQVVFIILFPIFSYAALQRSIRFDAFTQIFWILNKAYTLEYFAKKEEKRANE